MMWIIRHKNLFFPKISFISHTAFTGKSFFFYYYANHILYKLKTQTTESFFFFFFMSLIARRTCVLYVVTVYNQSYKLLTSEAAFTPICANWFIDIDLAQCENVIHILGGNSFVVITNLLKQLNLQHNVFVIQHQPTL